MLTSTRLRVLASLAVGHALIKNRPDDRYIVAHPRSGSTWLRTILVNIMVPEAKGNPDIFNAVIPGVTIRSLPRIYALSSPRIISSHTGYRRSLPPVVYLVRDGRDVAVSFYHYLFTRRNPENKPDFPVFVKQLFRGDYGYIWSKHIESWFTQGREEMAERLKIVHFDGLKSDTVKTVEDVAGFLELSATREQIIAAIQTADIKHMREVECQEWERKGLTPPQGDRSFYRGGKAGQWKDYSTPDLDAFFWKHAESAMRLAGYHSGE